MRASPLWRTIVSIPFLLIPFTADAARKPGADPAPPPAVRLDRAAPALESVRILRPSRESEVVPKRFFALEFSDGSRAVASTAIKPDAGSPRLYGQPVTWSVDLASGTYTARKTEPTERDLKMIEAARQRWGDLSAAEGVVEPEYEEWEAAAGYAYMHAAETWEVAAWLGADPLTRTEVELAWSECGTTWPRLYTDGFLPRCWANAATLGFGLTSWSTTSCSPRHPGSSSEHGLDGGVSGSYINWDWLDNRQATYAYQDVSISANFGGDGFGWVYQYQWGESSWIIGGREFRGTVWPRLASCRYRSGGGGGGGGGGGDDGGGDGGGGDGGGGGGGGGGSTWTCVEVTDGETGERLGDCCGYTTEAILDCAEGYLAE